MRTITRDASASKRLRETYLAAPDESSILSAMMMAGKVELRRISNHMLRTTLAGSPLLPSPLRWVFYRALGLRIYSPNVREQCVMHNSYLEIRRGAFVNRGCFFEGSGRIVIGERCQIGPQCTFFTSHHDAQLLGDELTVAHPVPRDIVIGARVWVGGCCTFLPGCYVDDDVVIAAGAVVSGHLHRGWVYGGVPAKQISRIPASA